MVITIGLEPVAKINIERKTDPLGKANHKLQPSTTTRELHLPIHFFNSKPDQFHAQGIALFEGIYIERLFAFLVVYQHIVILVST